MTVYQCPRCRRTYNDDNNVFARETSAFPKAPKPACINHADGLVQMSAVENGANQ